MTICAKRRKFGVASARPAATRSDMAGFGLAGPRSNALVQASSTDCRTPAAPKGNISARRCGSASAMRPCVDFVHSTYRSAAAGGSIPSRHSRAPGGKRCVSSPPSTIAIAPASLSRASSRASAAPICEAVPTLHAFRLGSAPGSRPRAQRRAESRRRARDRRKGAPRQTAAAGGAGASRSRPRRF